MRILPACLLLLVLVAAAPVAAQAMTQGEDTTYRLRAALGDIPVTDAAEPPGALNVEQRLTVQHTAGSQTQAVLHLPVGASLLGTDCSCTAYNVTEGEGAVTFTVAEGELSGDVVLIAASTQPAGTAFAFELQRPAEAPRDDAFVALYVPPGHGVRSNAVLSSMPCAEAVCDLHFLLATPDAPLPDGALWFAAHPGAVQVPRDPSQQPGDLALPALALGILGGAALWALLVHRGMVQKRTRKQVAGPAAHAAYASESKEVLEGRRRALMAALKELEMAKMNQDLDTQAYDRLKSDFKKETVAVMRALEGRP